MKSLCELLKVLCTERFWGEIVIRFQDGAPILVEKTQTIKFEK